MDKKEVFSNIKNKKKIILPVIIAVIAFSGWSVYNKRSESKDIVLYGNVDIRQVSLSI